MSTTRASDGLSAPLEQHGDTGDHPAGKSTRTASMARRAPIQRRVTAGVEVAGARAAEDERSDARSAATTAEDPYALHLGGGAAPPAERAPLVLRFAAGPAAAGQPAHQHFDRATGGAPAEVPHRAAMEQFFGEDLGGVRAFVDRPGELGAIGARAAARGEDVAFADRGPEPSLVAHEVAHVVQHRRGGGGSAAIAGAGGLGDPSSPAEREADEAAALFARGGARPALSPASAAGTPTIHRAGGGVVETTVDLVGTHGPALATALAPYFPDWASEQLTRMAGGLLEKLAANVPEALQLSPAALGVIAAGVGKLYAAYQKGDPEETPTERLKEAVHDTVPATLYALAATTLPASMFASVLPAAAATVVAGAAAWSVYLGARKLLPERGALPKVGDTLALAGGLLALEVTGGSRPWFGHNTVTARVTGNPADAAWLSAAGEVRLRMVDRTQLVSVADASQLVLEIGDFTIRRLVVNPEVEHGLSASAGEVLASWGGKGALTELAVSSGGWLGGSARVSGGGAQANGLEVANATIAFAPTLRDGVQLDLELPLEINGDRAWSELKGVVPIAHRPLQLVRHPIELGTPSLYSESLDFDSAFLTATATDVTLDGTGTRFQRDDGKEGKRVRWKATRKAGEARWRFSYDDAAAPQPADGPHREAAPAADAIPGPADPSEDAGGAALPGGAGAVGPGGADANEAEPPRPLRRGGKDLLSTLHDRFTAAAFENRNALMRHAVTPVLSTAHWAAWAWKKVKPATPAKADATPATPELQAAPPRPEQPAAEPGRWATLRSWLNPMEYSGIQRALEALPSFEFGEGLPELPKLSLDRLRFSVDDAGGKLMIRGGGALTVTMPGEPARPGPSGTGDVELRWFPFDEPHLALAAAISAPNLALTGIEADLSDGVRVAHGLARLPLPRDLAPDGYLQASMDYVQLGHGFRFRSMTGSLNNLKIPADATEQDVYATLVRAEVGGAAGARGTRFHIGANVKLHNLTEQPLEPYFDVAWGGGEPLAGRLGVKQSPFRIGDWLQATSAGIELAYGPGGFSGSVATQGLIARPADALEIEVGAATLKVSRGGLDGTTLRNVEATWHGMGVRLDALSLYAGGRFDLKGLSIVAAPARLAQLPFFRDAFTPPDWLNDVKVRVAVDVDGKQKGPPVVSRPRFGIVAAGVRLFGIGGGFDLEQGKAFVRLSKSGTFRPTAQFPVYPGVGVEVGGLLSYKVGLEGDARVSGATAEDPDAPMRIDGGLALRGSVEGSVIAGAFGGIPGVFTVGGGLHAGMKLAVDARARVDGALQMPSAQHPKGAGHFGFDFKIAGPGDQPATASVIAGPYVFVDFGGISKTMKLDLLSVPLLQLEAYGGLRLDAPPREGPGEDGKHLHTIPEPFPAYRVEVHPDIRKAFDSGKNALLKHRIRQAESQLGRELARVGAAEERIGDEQAVAALPGAEKDAKREEKRKADRERLAEARTAHASAERGASDVDARRKKLESEIEEIQLAEIYYRAKQRRYQWQLRANQPDAEPSMLEKAKHVVGGSRDALGHVRQGKLGAAIAATRSTAKGRAPSAEPVDARLGNKHAGTGEKRVLTTEELELKVKHKEEELARLAIHLADVQQQLTALEDGALGQSQDRSSAAQTLAERSEVVELHALPLERDYQASKQDAAEQRAASQQQQKAVRSDAVAELKHGKLVGAFTWMRSLGKSFATGVEASADSASRAMTSDEDKSLERYLDHHQGKLLQAWDKANHVYRISERRRAYDKAHADKRKAELARVEAKIAELQVAAAGPRPVEASKPPKPLPPTPPAPGQRRPPPVPPRSDRPRPGPEVAQVEQAPPSAEPSPVLAPPQPQGAASVIAPSEAAGVLPDPVTFGPAFEVAFELRFWRQRRDDLDAELQRLEEQRDDAVAMIDPNKKLSDGQRELLRHAVDAKGSERQETHEAEIARKRADLETAIEQLLQRREAEAALTLALDELEVRDDGDAVARAAARRELRGKLETATMKVKQQQFLADAAQAALDLTIRNIDESRLLAGDD